MSLVSRPYLGETKVHSAGYAIEFDHFLALNVGAMRPELSGKGWFNKGDPLCRTFGLISGHRPATVRALNDLAPAFSAFASAA